MRTTQPLQLHTPPEMQRAVADRVRQVRLDLGLKQATLAGRAGVTLASLRRFEQTGEASLKLFLRVCHALGRLDEFDAILRPPPARSLAELEARETRRPRQRGSR
ncbi:MAG: helix-turn-helix transcriptional regulator [Tepidisphaerales bacterium]